MPKTTSTTDLRDYALVADRIAEFYTAFPSGQILTEIISRDARETVVRASIYRCARDTRPSATGLAAEREGDGEINAVACLENTETSAIGRALANLGFLASRLRPSLEEIQKAARARARAGLGRTATEGHGEQPAGAVRVVREPPSLQLPTDNALQAQAEALTDCLALLQRAARLGFPSDKAERLRRRLVQSRSLAPSEVSRIERGLRDWMTSSANRVPDDEHDPGTSNPIEGPRLPSDE